MVQIGFMCCYVECMRNSLRNLLVGFAVVAASLFALAGVASAVDDGPYVGNDTQPRTQVLSENVSKGAAESASAESASAESAAAASLAFTGNDVLVLSAIGGAAVLAGGAILIARRRVVQA